MLTQNLYPLSNRAPRTQERLRCMITGTFTTDEELLELVAAVHPELPKTAQFALSVAVGTAATTDLHHSVEELEQRLHGTRGVDEVLAQYLYTALGWR